MSDSFGGRLRAERERRQLPLSGVASQTKISIHLLDGLERDDLSRWPAGIFRRSFLRVYADALGLDPEPLLREFLMRFPDPAEPQSARQTRGGPVRPSRHRHLASDSRRECLFCSPWPPSAAGWSAVGSGGMGSRNGYLGSRWGSLRCPGHSGCLSRSGRSCITQEASSSSARLRACASSVRTVSGTGRSRPLRPFHRTRRREKLPVKDRQTSCVPVVHGKRWHPLAESTGIAS